MITLEVVLLDNTKDRMDKTSTKTCSICFNIILPEDKVEILLGKIHYKHILGKYYWLSCDYCFSCLQIACKLQWRYFLSLMIEHGCRDSILATLQYYGVPERLTNNLKMDGQPIKALYYHGEMYSAKLETGLGDFEMARLKENIKNAQTLLEKEPDTITEFKNLFMNMKL